MLGLPPTRDPPQIKLTEFVSGKPFATERVVEQCRGAEEGDLGVLVVQASFKPNAPKMTEEELAAARAADEVGRCPETRVLGARKQRNLLST